MLWFIKFNIIIYFMYYKTFAQTPSPTYGVVFSASTTTTTPKPSQTGCRCATIGQCPTVPGIDVRIVNQGATFCSPGQVWCCDQPLINDTPSMCGIRRIMSSSTQQIGTAPYGAYPWQVALLLPDNRYFGSGVLINTNHVLTAAHKVKPYESTLSFKLRLGDWDGQALTEKDPYREYSPTRIFIHPNYNSQSLVNDIAIVRLNMNVPLSMSQNINTACLPTSLPVAGSRCNVAGWGVDAFATGAYQRLLKDVEVPIVDQTTCETRLQKTRLGQYFKLDRTSFICAGGEAGKDSCTGDGGAPLVCQSNGQFYVVGLVAWGIGCADSTVPGVYVNVFNYKMWINQMLIAR